MRAPSYICLLILIFSCNVSNKKRIANLPPDCREVLQTIEDKIYRVSDTSYGFRFVNPASTEIVYKTTERVREYERFIEYVNHASFDSCTIDDKMIRSIMGKEIKTVPITRDGNGFREGFFLYYNMNIGYNCDGSKKGYDSFCNPIGFGFDTNAKLYTISFYNYTWDIEPLSWGFDTDSLRYIGH